MAPRQTYLDTELVFEGSQRSGGGLLLSRGESSGGGDEGGEDSGLHCWNYLIVNYANSIICERIMQMVLVREATIMRHTIPTSSYWKSYWYYSFAYRVDKKR